MRRASGSSAQVSDQVAQVGPGNGAWWESRLLPYRQFVLFIWNSLTFSPTFLPGAAIWALLNILIMSLFQFSGNVLEVVGNLLVMVAILYALLHLGLRYGNLAMFPAWNGDNDRRFREICALMAQHVCVVSDALKGAIESRKSNPKLFYGVVFFVSFFLFHLGQWISTMYIVQLAVCGLLLLPLVMERSKSHPEQLRDKAKRIWLELNELAKMVVHKVSEIMRRIQARRNRASRAR